MCGINQGFPGGASGKELACQFRRQKRLRFDRWVEKIPWRSAWKCILIFLPGESLGQRNLVGCSSWDHKESDMTEQLGKAHPIMKGISRSASIPARECKQDGKL